MSYNTWPTFAGRGWNIKKRPITRTIIETADGGQEFRLARFQNPLYEFDIEIPYLSQADYATLQHFFAQQGGPFTPFLFYPDNEAATATPFFTGDGVTTKATLLMPDGSPALFANSGATPTVSAIHQTDWQGRIALSNQPRTNYVVNSVNLSGWTKNSVSVAAGLSAPDGSGRTMQRVTVTAASTDASVYALLGSGATAGKPYICSAVVRTDQNRYANFHGFGNGANGVCFDLQAQAAKLGAGSTWTAAGIVNLGNNLALIWGSLTPAANTGFYLCVPDNYGTSGNQTVGAFLDFYVPQAEDGSVYGVRIPTTTAAVTVTDYTQAGNQITFGQVPAVGATEDWDGTYAYLVRFKDDQIEMAQTMSRIYEATTVTLRSVR